MLISWQRGLTKDQTRACPRVYSNSDEIIIACNFGNRSYFGQHLHFCPRQLFNETSKGEKAMLVILRDTLALWHFRVAVRR